MMMLDAYPRCAAYLKGMNVRLNDASMTNYWGAVILADKWTDEALVKAGGVDFSDKTGEGILARFEALLCGAFTGKPKSGELSESQRAQLQAFLGSRGVKTSMLLSDDDYWKAALILWPSIKRYDGLEHLFNQIRSFSKGQRKTANANIGKLPREWISASKPTPPIFAEDAGQ